MMTIGGNQQAVRRAIGILLVLGLISGLSISPSALHGGPILISSSTIGFGVPLEVNPQAEQALVGTTVQWQIDSNVTFINPIDCPTPPVVLIAFNGVAPWDSAGLTIIGLPGQLLTSPSLTKTGSFSYTVTALKSSTSGDQTCAPPTLATLVVNGVADLSIAKIDNPDPVNVQQNLTWQNLTYTLTATNNGPSDATGVTVRDTLPGGVTYNSASASQGSCSQAAGVVTCNLGTIANGANATATINVTPTSAGTITNSATVSGTEADSNANNNTATQGTTVNPAADLSLTKTDNPDPVNAGANLTYTVTVTNNGPNTATSVTVIDTLPVEVKYVNASGTGWTCNQTGQAITCTRPTLDVGVAPSITISVTAPDDPPANLGGFINNTATVTSDTADPNANNNSATQATQVAAASDLAISISDAVDPQAIGVDVPYFIKVINNGPSVAKGVRVTLSPDPTVTLVNIGDCNLFTLRCDIGTLAKGVSATLIITVHPTQVGNIAFTASVSGNQIDPVNTNNTATETTQIWAFVSGKIFVNLSRPAGAKVNPAGFYSGKLPLRKVKVTLELSGSSNVRYTDQDGKYIFMIPIEGQPAAQLKVTLEDQEGLVSVFDVDKDPSNVAWARTKAFVVLDKAPTTQDFEMKIANDNSVTYNPDLDATNPTNSTKDRFAHLAYAYHDIKFASQFAVTALSVSKSERVIAYETPAAMHHSGDPCSTHELSIPRNRASANVDARPNADFHEYGHHIMCASPIAGTEKLPDRGTGNVNHGNLNNSTSADSWAEGFATYMSAATAEYGGDPKPSEVHILGGVLDLVRDDSKLDDPEKANDPLIPELSDGAISEETAIADLLWDVHQRIGRNKLWTILKANTPDLQTFKDVYDALAASGELSSLTCTINGVNVTGVDCLFIKRGFYHDQSGDGKYEAGEKVGVTRWARVATVERKGGGREVPIIPGSTLLLHVVDAKTGAPLDNVQFLVTKEYDPPLQDGTMSYLVIPQGISPYQVPVKAPGSSGRALIIAQRDGYINSSPLSIDWLFYRDKINPYKPGFSDTLLEHTFQMTSIGAETATVFRVERSTGDVRSDGSFNCGLGSPGPVSPPAPPCFNTGIGADIAERIDVSERVESGDLVEPDPNTPKRYRKTRSSHSLSVAGVITSLPGFVLANRPEELDSTFISDKERLLITQGLLQYLAQPGQQIILQLSLMLESLLQPEKSEDFSIARLAESWEPLRSRSGRPLLALMGRVRVKATTENGPIRSGDLLISASKPGYAMRCVEVSLCEGAVVGKALENLEQGEGLILILVMSR